MSRKLDKYLNILMQNSLVMVEKASELTGQKIQDFLDCQYSLIEGKGLNGKIICELCILRLMKIITKPRFFGTQSIF